MQGRVVGEAHQGGRSGLASAGFVSPQGVEKVSHGLMAVDGMLVRHLPVRRALVDHQHPRLARAAPVHPAEPLHHALPGDQVADHVVGVEIDPDLAGGCRDEKHGDAARGGVIADQPMVPKLLGGLLPLMHPPAADEQDHVGPGLFPCRTA